MLVAVVAAKVADVEIKSALIAVLTARLVVDKGLLWRRLGLLFFG